MFTAVKKYRIRIALLNAVFIGLITSGVRHYGEKDDLLYAREIMVLFLDGFLLALISWFLIFRMFDFKTAYGKHGIVRFVGLFLLIMLVTTGFYIGLLSCFREVLVENRSKFYDLSDLVSWGGVRVLLINVFVLTIKYSTDSNEAKREALLKNEMLMNENIVSKYEALKQQVNPHFLFNSLNSLKSLIKTDTERSVDFVIRLSDVYRYLLKHGAHGTVALREELDFMNAYIFLLERRYEQNLHIDVDLPEEYLDTMIPPVSLQILVENAVKHNIVSSARPLNVRIAIEDNCILVENNLQPKYSTEKSEKIGLGTIDNRYRLLTEKRIEVKNEEGKFRVYLPLILAV